MVCVSSTAMFAEVSSESAPMNIACVKRLDDCSLTHLGKWRE